MNAETLTRAFGVRFRPSQDNFKAVCPFHDERTASFYVHRDEFMANCFGCGKAGYIDRLLAEHRGIDDREARQLLGIEFVDKLTARAKGRQVTEPEYFPKSWLAPFNEGVHRSILSRGFTQETLKRAGSLYDAILKRQVFPHFNRDGRLLGCAGRSCYGQDPKWYFYWDYPKGRTLYRLPNQGSVEVHRSERLIVTEGIFDLLRLYQAGYRNLASTLGTKFTRWQVEDIKNSTDEVIVVGDNDPAGVQYENKLHEKLKKSTTTFFITYGEESDLGECTEERAMELLEGAQTRLQQAL